MDFSSFLPLLKQIAPSIATALATSIGGPVAGLAVKALSSALLGTPDGTPREVSDALGIASPDQLLQIKKMDNDFAVQMRALDIDLEKIDQADRSSARGMQIDIKSKLVPVLAVVIVSAFICVTIGTLMGYAKVESAFAGSLIGYLSAKAEQVISFYFGSSNSSHNKDLMLYNSTPK